MRGLILITALLVCFYFSIFETKEPVLCNSMDIRNDVKEFEKLRNCTIITGYLQILLIETHAPEAFHKYTFPELREITDYMLIYRVHNLTSIGKLFPNLTMIRGRSLFVNYALVIYDMPSLYEIGLYSLTKIVRGTVRIEKNFKLCNLANINWTYITHEETHLSSNGGLCDISGQKKYMECPARCKGACWNNEHCQEIDLTNTCPDGCLYGCQEEGICESCEHYIEDNKCVTNCSANRYLVAHVFRCVSAQECRNMEGNWWVHERDCVNNCPPYFQEINGSCQPCPYCHKICNGSWITNIDGMELFRGCTTINGSLGIRLDINTVMDIEGELEKNLGDITQIGGFLKIHRSPQIRSLNFLKNLRVINGTKLDLQRYVLIIQDNVNLQKLWDWERFNMTIKRGTISFHFNSKLCYSEIETLVKLTKLPRNFTNIDVSDQSNGEDLACMPNTIDIKIARLMENNVTLQWKPVLSHNNVIMTRYTIFYKETDYDVYEDEEEDLCGKLSWSTTVTFYDETDKNLGPDTIFTWNITNLKTFTNYTYYIRTDDWKGGRSLPQFFMTLSGDPSNPLNVRAEVNDSDALRVSWEKPTTINGILSHYVIMGFIQEDDPLLIDSRNYCKAKLLEECSDLQPEQPPTTPPTTTLTWLEQMRKRCNCSECPSTAIQSTAVAPTNENHDDFDSICTDLDRYSYMHGNISEVQSCASYRYQIVPMNQNLEETNLIEKRENDVYKVFEKYAGPNDTSLVIDDLKHYTIYILLVAACNQNRTEKPQCSGVVMVSQRTGRKFYADDIRDVIVRIVGTKTVEIEWRQPQNPNAVIVSYELQYKITNNENSQMTTECITRKQHEENDFVHILRDLHWGHYQLSVRAISLAGPGNESPKKYFSLENPNRPYLLPWVIVCIFAIVGTISGIFVWRCRTSYRRVPPLIARVNPHYCSSSYRDQAVDDSFEVPTEQVELQEIIGHGGFGVVYKGNMNTDPEEDPIPCAIKTINIAAPPGEVAAFLHEAQVMKGFSDAQHIVRLLGVVSKGPRPMVIMELMCRGDLKNYLRSKRESSQALTCSEMYRMAIEIADGMAYLAAKKFVHRDLAARNCMVSAGHTVKIGDFGMTRDIYETDYYRKETKGLLPVRWMAPESLADGVFTSDSDCWSYGVVLWEIATLAEQPYQGMANEQVLQFVTSKGILPRPVECPDILHEIMTVCWNWVPHERPLFTDIVERLERHVGQDFRLVSFHYSRAGEEYRRNQVQINAARASNLPAMAQGRLGAHWTKEGVDQVRFHVEEGKGRNTPSVSYGPDLTQPSTSKSAYGPPGDQFYTFPTSIPKPETSA